MNELERYSLIDTKMRREFVLLQGKGCAWKKCSYCDYYSDVSDDPYAVNTKVLAHVTGKYGVLDVINSGSAFELDPKTIELIKSIVASKNIHTLWFEAHYMYRNRLAAFAEQFPGVDVKFRCGVETFDTKLRNSWDKGIGEDVTPEEIAKYFKGVCLLICTTGHTREIIKNDIMTASKYFEYFNINAFCNNSTEIRRDEELVQWFTEEIYPQIKDDDRIEVLLNNTDLGVG